MLNRHLQTNGCVVQPEELALLQRVFDDFCAAKGIERHAVAATDAAFFLISIYQSGVTDKEHLRRSLELQGAHAHPMLPQSCSPTSAGTMRFLLASTPRKSRRKSGMSK
jgi:hypothetical protein